MQAPPLVKGQTKALPVRTDPISVRAAKVAAQLLPLTGSEAGVFVWEAWTMTLPSGRKVTPALAIRPSSVGPHDLAASAASTRLIVDVVPEGAHAGDLEALLAEYVAIPALGDVVRVGLRRRAVVVYSRSDGWQRRAYARGMAPLPGLGTSLSVSTIYR